MNNNHHDEDTGLKTQDDKPSVKLKYEGFGGAYKFNATTSPINALIDPGTDPLGLAGKTILHERRTEGSIMAIVNARDYADCVEFEDDEDAQELLMVMSGDNSVNGTARNQYVDAYIGERRHQEHEGLFQGLFNHSSDKDMKNNG